MANRYIVALLALAFTVLPLAQAQDEERIRQLFEGAIDKMGGDAFLQVTDIVSEGNYFFFDRDGNSSGLIKYSDYTKLPDKSRFELGNKKNMLDVTVFNLEKNEGWILEGQKETRDAKPEEMKDFKAAVKHSLDNILRFRYRDSANKLFYLGAGAGMDVQFELVKILDPENDEVTLYFDRMSKLPAKLEYRSVNSRGIRQLHREEFSQWLEYQGVYTPLRMDHFINGYKYSQMYITKITYNNNLPESFFSKPIPPK